MLHTYCPVAIVNPVRHGRIDDVELSCKRCFQIQRNNIARSPVEKKILKPLIPKMINHNAGKLQSLKLSG